jgi:succinyl-diaminopimelate desuccinylase
MMKKEILRAIRPYEADILQFTEQMMAIPTENPPGNCYRQCADLIARKLDELGIDSQVIEVAGAADNGSRPDFTRYIVLASHGRGNRSVYFHGHYDVVPASDASQFQPYTQRANLFGRGSSDMKGGLAAMIYAVKALKDCSIELDGQIVLTIVPDEETGGRFGSQFLTDSDQLGKNGIGMLTPEPTSGVIWNANRGAISLLVKVKGKPAHVGLQYQGKNAFEQMLRIAQTLLEHKAEVELRQTSHKVRHSQARNSILMLGGICSAGTNFNLVPGECSFSIDRRINPEEDLQAEKSALLDILDRMRNSGIDLEVELLQEAHSAGTAADDPLVRTVADSALEVTGSAPAVEMCPGLLETRFYSRMGVPAIGYGPGLLSVSHGPNEFVKISDLSRFAAIYALSAERLLNRPAV